MFYDERQWWLIIYFEIFEMASELTPERIYANKNRFYFHKKLNKRLCS